MRFEAGSIFFNAIYIVQSLRADDRKTGQELFDDIIRWRTSESLDARVDNIFTKVDLFKHFDFIRNNIDGQIFPFIHFEAHGFKDGIELSSGEEVTWTEIVPFLRAINLRTKNNLFISMAACKGGNIQYAVKITEPCPFRGFIGPMENVGENDLLTSYNEFFDSLLRENDFEKAIESLNLYSNGVKYHHMNAEAFFDVVLKYNEELEKGNPAIFLDRVEFLVQGELKRNPLVLKKFGSIDNLRKWIEKYALKHKPEMVEILRKRFCHID